MLDVGFGELFCFGMIALLVLGPDKLPVAARFAGRWYARAKRYISNIQNEIDRELKLSEFRKEMQDELDRLHSLEQSMQARLKEIEKASQEQRIHLAEQPEAACAPQLKQLTSCVMCHSTLYRFVDINNPEDVNAKTM